MAESLISLYSDESYGTDNGRKNLIELVPSNENDGSHEAQISDADQFLTGMELEQAFKDFSMACKVSVAGRCVHSLNRIQESTRSDKPIVISSSVAINKDVWKIEMYGGNGVTLPVENVTLKVNVLRTVIATVEEYSHKASSRNSIEVVAKTLQYLSKLAQSCLVSPGFPHGRTTNAVTTDTNGRKQPGQQRDEKIHISTNESFKTNFSATAQDNSSTYSQKSSGNRSISSSVSKRSIFQKMKNMNWNHGSNVPNDSPSASNLKNKLRSNSKRLPIKTNISSASSGSHHIGITKPLSLNEGQSTSASSHIMKSSAQYERQDMAAMPEYINLVNKLSTQVSSLPLNSQNDIIFSFLNKCIIPFIINDARLLQIEFIKTRIVYPLR